MKRTKSTAAQVLRPEVEVSIKGLKFRLCISYGALAVAQTKLRSLGVNINLLLALNPLLMGPDNLPALFFGAAHQQHPKLTYDEAVSLIDLETWEPVMCAVLKAYELAMPKSDKGTPRNPPAVEQS